MELVAISDSTSQNLQRRTFCPSVVLLQEPKMQQEPSSWKVQMISSGHRFILLGLSDELISGKTDPSSFQALESIH